MSWFNAHAYLIVNCFSILNIIHVLWHGIWEQYKTSQSQTPYKLYSKISRTETGYEISHTLVDVTNMTNMLLVACRSLRCHENRGEACNSWHSARDAFAKVASGRGRGEGGTEGPGGVQLFTSAERKCTRFNPSHPLTIDHHFTVNCVVCPISSLFQVLSVQW